MTRFQRMTGRLSGWLGTTRRIGPLSLRFANYGKRSGWEGTLGIGSKKLSLTMMEPGAFTHLSVSPPTTILGLELSPGASELRIRH
jgi:hypothetical protein